MANLYSPGIRHMVALMGLLHDCVHQTHIKRHARTMLHEHFDFYSLNGSLEDINGHMYIALHKVNLPKHDE